MSAASEAEFNTAEQTPHAWLQFRTDREDGGEGTKATWERLRTIDEAILETLWQEKGETAPVFGGRWEAHMGRAKGTAEPGAKSASPGGDRATPSKDDAEAVAAAATAKSAAVVSMGTLHPRYYNEGARPLVRSTWCYRYWPNGLWQPFARDDDEAIEALWQAMARGQVLPDQ